MKLFFLCLLAPLTLRAADWRVADAIVARIEAPSFRPQQFPITQFGASAEGRDCTAAIRAAIAACHQAGGGHVIVPAGTFRTGPVRLLSRVDLHLERGAVLQFSPNPADYLPAVRVRWEGIECMNYSPLIYAYEQENIAVTGPGTLDGSASPTAWWDWTQSAGHPSRALPDARRLAALADRGVPAGERVFGPGHFLRPNFFVPYRCHNVLISDVTFVRSPMWEINPVLCESVTVRGVRIDSTGPNNDGCDPDSCRDVLVERCVFRTGDDCIAIKSGRDTDGRAIAAPAENIVVRDCRMEDGHGGVVIGSEISAGCRNVFVENCEMSSPNLGRVLRFKSNARRGGVIENVFARNLKVGSVAEAIVTVDFLYENGAVGPLRPVLRHVEMENVVSEHTPRVLFVASFPGAQVDDLRFLHCTFRGLEHDDIVAYTGRILFDDVTLTPLHPERSLFTRGPGQL